MLCNFYFTQGPAKLNRTFCSPKTKKKFFSIEFCLIVDYNSHMQLSEKVNPEKAGFQVTVLVAIRKHIFVLYTYILDIQCIFYDDVGNVKSISFCVKRYHPRWKYFELQGIVLPIPAQRHPVIFCPPNKQGAFAASHYFTNQACHKDSLKAAGANHTLSLLWSGLPLGGF